LPAIEGAAAAAAGQVAIVLTCISRRSAGVC